MSAPAHTHDGFGDRVSLERFVTALDGAGVWHRLRGDHVDFRCPLPDHEDASASGSADWKPADGRRPGRMLLQCHRCGRERTRDIVEALSLSEADLYDDPPARPDSSSPRAGRPTPARPAAPTPERGPGKAAAPVRVPTTRTRRVFTTADNTQWFRLNRYDPTGPRAAEGRKGFSWEHRGGPRGGWRSGKRCPDSAPEVCESCRRGLTPQVVPLYQLGRVRDAVASGGRVWICEGGKNADDLAAALPNGDATTSAPDGANSSWEAEYTRALAGAEVTIVADRDVPGYRYAAGVAGELTAAGCTVRVVRTPLGIEHADVSDHLAAGLPLDELEAGDPAAWSGASPAAVSPAELPAEPQSEPAPESAGATVHQLTGRRDADDTADEPTERKGKGGGKGGGGGSQALQLLEMALQDYEPIWTETGEHYLVPLEGPKVARPLRGGARSFTAELVTKFYERRNSVPGHSATTDALRVLQGLAERTEAMTMPNRVCRHDGGLVVDLGDETGRAIVVTEQGWRVVAESPVLFRRTVQTGTLPVPQRGGDLAELWKLANVRPADRGLAEAELVFRYFAKVSHPLLALTGEAGTGKTFAAETLSGLVDPSPTPKISLPTDPKDWAVQVGQSYSLVIDNVHSLQQWQSDALCMAVTGGHTQYRQLYTDGGLARFGGQQCITLTAIDLGSQKADLTTRLLPVELEPFTTCDDGERMSEERLEETRTNARPRILGVLLDRAAQVLGMLPRVDGLGLSLPRLSDFARVCKALDMVDDDGSDRYGEYLRLVSQQAGDIADEDEVAAAIITWMAARNGDAWEGNATELLTQLTRSTMHRSRYWPETAGAFGKRLSSVVAPLREAGIDVAKPSRSSGKRVTRVSRRDVTTAPDPITTPDPTPISSPREEAPSAPATADPAPSSPPSCPECSVPGPFCGPGGVAEEQEPCVLCHELTRVRARCGAARHGQCRGDVPARPETPDPTPPEPEPEPASESEPVIEEALEPVESTPDREPAARSTTPPERRIRPTAHEVGDRISAAEELKNFTTTVVKKHPDADPEVLRAALERFHEVTDGLAFVSYPGQVGVAAYARLVARHATMPVPLKLDNEEVSAVSRELTLFRDHLVPGVKFSARTEHYITSCDVNAQFLAAASSVEVGDGDPRVIESPRSLAAVLDLPGYIQLGAAVSTKHSAFGRLAKGSWLTTQSAKYLVRNREVEIPASRALIWDTQSKGRRLSAWSKLFGGAYRELKAANADDLASRYALVAVKSVYTAFLGGMIRSEKYNKTGLLRPDWSDQLVTLAAANMWRALDKIKDTDSKLVGVWRDTAWFSSTDSTGPSVPSDLVLSDQPGKWHLDGSRFAVLTEEMREAHARGSAAGFRDGLIRESKGDEQEGQGSQ